MASLLFKYNRLFFPYILKFRIFVKPISRSVPFKVTDNYSSQIKRIVQQSSKCNINIMKMLSFSIFTWLGLEKESDEDSELILTIKRSVLLIRRKEYPKAERMLHVALRLAQQLQDQLAITYVFDLMANLALENNQLDKANKLFVGVMQRLLANNVSEDDLKIVHINLKLARINHLKSNFAQAQSGYEWSLYKLENYKRESNSDSLKLYALAKNWYGHLLLDGDKLKEGLRYLLDSHLIYMDCDDKEEDQIAIQLSDIAVAFEKNDDLESSEKYFLEAIEKGKKIKEFEYLGVIYINLGRLYIRKKLYDIARKRCGYGWRLGYDNSNKEIQNEALECVKEIEKITGRP